MIAGGVTDDVDRIGRPDGDVLEFSTPDWVLETVVGSDAIRRRRRRDILDGSLPELASELESTGTKLQVALAVANVAGPRSSSKPLSGLRVVILEGPKTQALQWLVKSAPTASVTESRDV